MTLILLSAAATTVTEHRAQRCCCHIVNNRKRTHSLKQAQSAPFVSRSMLTVQPSMHACVCDRANFPRPSRAGGHRADQVCPIKAMFSTPCRPASSASAPPECVDVFHVALVRAEHAEADVQLRVGVRLDLIARAAECVPCRSQMFL